MDSMSTVKGFQMRMLFILFFVLWHQFAYAEGQLFTDWLKTGPAKQPRYFLKNSRVSLCGFLDEVSAFKVDNQLEKLQIKSCLMASDSLDDAAAPEYEIVDLKGENLLIRNYIEKGEAKKIPNPIYTVPSRQSLLYGQCAFPKERS
jgi:hypothetical protein